MKLSRNSPKRETEKKEKILSLVNEGKDVKQKERKEERMFNKKKTFYHNLGHPPKIRG